MSKASLRLKSGSLERATLAFSRSCSLVQRSLRVWTSSSSSCGLSLGPGDPLTGDPPPLPPVLLADDCLAGEPLYLNGEAAPPLPPVLLADEALAGDLVAAPPPPPPAPLLTNSANSL
jgi:hypothetical protein